MDQNETVALFLQGREAWNSWAFGLLRERETIKWARDVVGRITPVDEVGRNWLSKAGVDFTGYHFGSEEQSYSRPENANPRLLTPDIVFEGFVFPDAATFDGAKFVGLTSFNQAHFLGRCFFQNCNFFDEVLFFGTTFEGNVSFGDAKFEGSARFNMSQFKEKANFNNTRFMDHAFFGDLQFPEEVGFGDASFLKGATFSGAKFGKRAFFLRTHFADFANFGEVSFDGFAIFVEAAFGDCWFEYAEFNKMTSFSKAKFKGDARFSSVTFGSSTYFTDCEFGSKEKPTKVSFTSIKADREFNLSGATFSTVPAFNPSDFKQPPDFDNVHFPPPMFWRGHDADLIPRYRLIRRMAIQGIDYEREQMAFKGELRSRRGTLDKWWHLNTWLGVLYDGIADCGRSFVRPFLIWGMSIFVLGLVYLKIAILNGESWYECLARGDDPWRRALFLSERSAFVILNAWRDARVNSSYHCLFGGTTNEPNIPDGVTIIESAQASLSAALIFLILLAIKNRFKIK